MKSQWLPYAILRTASLLAPGDQRAEWLDGWHSELWYIPRRGATRFCLGAFPDALWLNNLSPVKQTGIRLESPLACLAFLATLAAVSLLIAVRLPAPDTMTRSPHLGFLNLLEGCIAMLMISVLILPAIRLAMGPSADRCPMPWRSKLRRGIFRYGLDWPGGASGAAVGDLCLLVSGISLGADRSAAALPRMPPATHRPDSHRQRIANVPGMVRRRVDLLARTWTAAYFGNAGELLGETGVAPAGRFLEQPLSLGVPEFGNRGGAATMTLELRRN
jgi:hypothetical protein